VTIQRKLFWIFDFACLLLAFLLAGWVAPLLHAHLSVGGSLYGNWIATLSPPEVRGTFPPLHEYLWVFFLVAPVTVLCIDVLGGHIPIRSQRPLRIIFNAIVAPVSGVALLSTVFFALKTLPGYSRLFVFAFVGTSGLVICASRFIGREWYKFSLRQGMYVEEVAIVGRPEAVEIVAQRFRNMASPLEYRLVGFFSLSPRASDLILDPDSTLTLLGQVKDLEEVLVQQAIQRIFLILPARDSHWLENAVSTCDYFRVTTHILPETLLTSPLVDLVADRASTIGPIAALTLAPPELHSDWLFIKRLLDVTVSGAALVILSPLLLLIAAAIKLTTPRLPIFFPWRVVGYRGRRFTGYKFTTMVADAETKRLDLQSLNEMTGPVFKIAKDPRVTPFGRFLRKYSLNELPQLWSVLKGDMSLVGPRPAWPHELERYELWHKRKLSAQPGLTCFWQIRGRNRISNFDDWVNLDLEYIQTRSLWVDCKILAKTAWVVIRGTGS
jgi:exopolysaccharide biosynthesis polyprenyl glycosylphosphotransferase